MSEQSLPLTEAVISRLTQSEFPSTLTIEQCAADIAMSMTSFRRKLSNEETSFKLIQSKFLNELCVQALLTNKVNIEQLAIKLGYSERATFERAFRQKFGITPAQFSKLAMVGEHKDSYQQIVSIAQNMPPMPDSCRQLIKLKEQDSLDLSKVVTVIEKDPVFSGRVIGLASRAVYGKTPRDVKEAVGRNLGINNVLNLAIVYGVKDILQSHIDKLVIEQYIQAFLIAPKLFQLIRKSVKMAKNLDISLTEQLLSFALLGVFLLSHKQAHKHELMLYALQGVTNLSSLNGHIRQTMGASIFSASALMLSLWHIDAELIKQLNHLDKVSQKKTKGKKEDELLLFMLSYLYCLGAGHKDFSELTQKAELLGIENFEDIQAALTTS